MAEIVLQPWAVDDVYSLDSDSLLQIIDHKGYYFNYLTK